MAIILQLANTLHDLIVWAKRRFAVLRELRLTLEF